MKTAPYALLVPLERVLKDRLLSSDDEHLTLYLNVMQSHQSAAVLKAPFSHFKLPLFSRPLAGCSKGQGQNHLNVSRQQNTFHLSFPRLFK